MNLVVGATGSLGGRITHGLLARGKPVRILARHNSPSEELAKQGRANTAQSLIAAGAEVVHGDLKDRASLNEAVAGVDTVITTATATQRAPRVFPVEKQRDRVGTPDGAHLDVRNDEPRARCELEIGAADIDRLLGCLR